MVRPRTVAALALAAALAAPAGAATSLRVVKADGFSLRVPVAWRTLKNVGTVELMAIAPERQGGFYVNANVVVTPAASGLPTGARSELIESLRKAGIAVTALSTRNVRLPGGRAVELRYSGTMIGRRLTWLAYVLQRGDRTYVITFTAARGSYARHAALFGTMARSFRYR